MVLKGTLRKVSLVTCDHCSKEISKHSKKDFIRCLYTANFNLRKFANEVAMLREYIENGQKVEPPKDTSNDASVHATESVVVKNEQ